LTYLKEFDLALAEFNSAKEIDPKQSTIIYEYIKELERCRLADNQEKAAQLFLTSCSQKNDKNDLTDYLEILNTKLFVKDQNIWYYSGGLRCLTGLTNDGIFHFLIIFYILIYLCNDLHYFTYLRPKANHI
jgi:hypothetical protein